MQTFLFGGTKDKKGEVIPKSRTFKVSSCLALPPSFPPSLLAFFPPLISRVSTLPSLPPSFPQIEIPERHRLEIEAMLDTQEQEAAGLPSYPPPSPPPSPPSSSSTTTTTTSSLPPSPPVAPVFPLLTKEEIEGKKVAELKSLCKERGLKVGREGGKEGRREGREKEDRRERTLKGGEEERERERDGGEGGREGGREGEREQEWGIWRSSPLYN